MKPLLSIVVLALGMIGTADGAVLDRLVAGQDKALEAFKTDEVVGQFYTVITAFSIEARGEANEGAVQIKYRDNGTTLTKDYLIPLENLPPTTEIGELSRTWGVNELRAARAAALVLVREELGELAESVYGITMTRNASGKSGTARILYKEGEESKVKSHFCHVHAGEDIDCH